MSAMFSLRLPDADLEWLRAVARRRGVGPTQLAREWLAERVAAETPTVREPATRYTAIPPGDPEAVADACKRRGVRRLRLFGSATRDDFDPARSDVDVAVDLLDMPPGMRADAFFGLQADLEAISGRAVDLVEVEAVRNPHVRAAIEAEGVTVYDAS